MSKLIKIPDDIYAQLTALKGDKATYGDCIRQYLQEVTVQDIYSHTLVTILAELFNVTSAYPKFHSPHEGYAVILEEMEELKREVFRSHATRSNERMGQKAVQVAAMAIRFILDVT